MTICDSVSVTAHFFSSVGFFQCGFFSPRVGKPMNEIGTQMFAGAKQPCLLQVRSAIGRDRCSSTLAYPVLRLRPSCSFCRMRGWRKPTSACSRRRRVCLRVTWLPCLRAGCCCKPLICCKTQSGHRRTLTQLSKRTKRLKLCWYGIPQRRAGFRQTAKARGVAVI
jgi:hypothetical protein